MNVAGAQSERLGVCNMFEWWNGLQLIEQVFYVIAIPATIILVLQTILLLFGFGHDSDADVDHDMDMDNDFDHDVGHDGSGAEHVAGLRLLSVRGFVAFFAVCGWVGVALLDMDVNPVVSVCISILAGFLSMLLVAVVMRFAIKMQQSGNLDMKNAVGLTGEVYIPIPAEGKGKVTLVIQERFMELDAVSPGEALKTGQRIKVTDVTESNTLVVAPIS